MSKLKPALLGGLIVGVLSVIPFVNYCCCLWAIGGGALAGMLYIKGSPLQVKTGDGAIVGSLAGLVGALIYLLIGLPIAYFYSGAAMEEAFRNSGVQMPLSGTLLILVGSLAAALFLVALSTVGGLLAVPLFEKRKGVMSPPPPATGGGPGVYPG